MPVGDESDRFVKAFRVRIADNVDRLGAAFQRLACRIFHQCPSYAGFPDVRFDEQAVELRVAVVALNHDGKPDDATIKFSDANRPGGDVLNRQLDGIRIGQQGLPVSRIAKRGAALQFDQIRPLVLGRPANGNPA